MVEPVERDARGILDPEGGLEHWSLERHAPSPDVGRFVDRYWIARWDLPPGAGHTQRVLPHPVVNLVVEAGEARAGIESVVFSRRLEGRGLAFGVMFRPGGFRPLLDAARPMTDLVDVTIPFDVDGVPDPNAVDEHLLARLPADPQPCEQTSELVEKAAGDPSLCRVEDLAERAGVSVRTLQRRFADHVGLSPKQVLRRYRLYDAAERVRGGERVDWAAVAADLGYADQSHLTNDFRDAFGVTPAAYARGCAEGGRASRRRPPALS